MTKRVAFCLFFIIIFSVRLFQQNYTFTNFSIKDGLPQPYVYSIIQDKNGYLWIGTSNGLSRFNGFDFKTFTTNDSLSDNFITCSFKNGTDIWFGHMKGQVTRFNGKEFIPVLVTENDISITDIEKSPDGSLWAGTTLNGLIKIENNMPEEKTFKPRQLNIITFKFLQDGKVLVGTASGLNYCRIDNKGQIEVIRKINEIPGSKVADIIKMKNKNAYYIATENDGVYTLTPDDKKFKVSKLKDSDDATGIQSIFEDSKNNIWIASFGKGLVKINADGDLYFINKSSGFSTNNVKTIFEDREGNIWSGNYGNGLTRVIEKQFVLHSYNNPEFGNGVHSITKCNGYWWIGTDKGVLKVNVTTGKAVKFISYKNGLPVGKVTSLFSRNNNELWIGTEEKGLYLMELEHEKVKQYKIANGTLENSVTCLTGNAQNIWIGTKKGVCSIDLFHDKIEWFTLDKNGLPHNYINNIYLDKEGNVWITMLGNYLAFIEKGQIGKIMITSGKPIISLGPVIEDNDSGIWIGSNGGGIFRVKNKLVVNLTSKEGLISDYCYSLAIDSENNLWVSHKEGLSRIRIKDFSIKSFHNQINNSTDCRFIENSVCYDEKNRILFGSQEGLWVLNNSDKNIEKPPVLNITSVKVNNNDIPFDEKISLSAGKYKLKIDFIGVNLKEPELVSYTYQMKGYDLMPENTNKTSVTYPRLSEGKYIFTLTSISGDGIENTKPLTLNINIKIPFWKKWWFYVLGLVTLVFLVTVYIKSINLKHRKERQQLEQKVIERTREIIEKKNLLELKQKEIIKQNAELKKYRDHLEQLVDERTKELLEAKIRAEESDRLKSSFLDNLSHEIRTPLNAICGFSNVLGEEDLPIETRREYVNIINNSSDSLLSMIDEIMEISMLKANQFIFLKEDFVLNDFLKNLCLNYKESNKKNLSIEFKTNENNDGLILYTDKKRLYQVLNNLLKNAVKFTEKGKISFGYTVEDKFIKFFVSDTGIGIEESEREKIFEPFYKIEKDTDKLYRGTGIGLSICKKIVNLMEGEIWLESEFGKGSTFYFTIPVTNLKTDQKEITTIQEFKRDFLKNVNILIADDDPEDFRLFNVILKSYKAHVYRVKNYKEAISFVKGNKQMQNLILMMDIDMPLIDTYKATKGIRKINPNIPIIALPLYNQKDKRKLKEIFNDYISKPVEINSLLKTLSKFV